MENKMDSLLLMIHDFVKNDKHSKDFLNVYLVHFENDDLLLCYQTIFGARQYLRKCGIILPDNIEELAKGVSRRYYSDGTPNSIIHYKDGKINGLYTTYYETGAIRSKCIYLNNEIHGIFINYKRDGSISRIRDFIHGYLRRKPGVVRYDTMEANS